MVARPQRLCPEALNRQRSLRVTQSRLYSGRRRRRGRRGLEPVASPCGIGAARLVFEAVAGGSSMLCARRLIGQAREIVKKSGWPRLRPGRRHIRRGIVAGGIMAGS